MSLGRKRSTVAPARPTKTSRRRLTIQNIDRKHINHDQTPQQQVLNDTRLLEAILRLVDDTRTILLSQRVNKTFRDSIRGSPLLRQKLWLEPNPDIQLWHRGRLNPLLSRSVARKKHKHILALTHSGCDICMLATMKAQTLQVTGSWRDMLVYQPHSPFATFKTADCWASSESFRQNAFRDPPTAGELVEMSSRRAQKASPPQSMQGRRLEFDRKCGRSGTGYYCGRTNVLVP